MLNPIAHRYAAHVLKGRWAIAEVAIASDASAAMSYVEQIIQGPWPMGEPAIKRSASCAYRYATRYLKSRWPDAEPFILMDRSIAILYAGEFVGDAWPSLKSWALLRPVHASQYAISVLKARWTEAEHRILLEPSAACGYAQFVIGDRWPEAETIIATDPDSAAEYAIFLLKARWIEAEAAIANAPVAASRYSRWVIGSKWPQGEAAIARHPQAALEYAREIILSRWPEGEAAIAKSPQAALEYARDIIRGRWPEGERVIAPRYHFALAYAQEVIGGDWPEAGIYLEVVRSTVHVIDESSNDDPELLKAEISKSSAINLSPVFAELNRLVGLSAVKAELRKLAAFAVMQRRRKEAGLRPIATTLHLVFTGNPGTGKTTVARLVGKIYADLDLLKKGHLVEAERANLIAEYVGQTDAKTKAKISEAEDGVLFVDEAYTLAPPHPHLEFGKEAINALLTEMENKRDRLAVIVAGYPAEMQAFIEANPGLKSRFTRYISFEDYSANEMLEILLALASQNEYAVSADALDELRQHFDKVYALRQKGFGNGRYVRTLFERMIELHSLRCTDDAAIDIATLRREDIPQDL